MLLDSVVHEYCHNCAAQAVVQKHMSVSLESFVFQKVRSFVLLQELFVQVGGNVVRNFSVFQTLQQNVGQVGVCQEPCARVVFVVIHIATQCVVESAAPIISSVHLACAFHQMGRFVAVEYGALRIQNVQRMGSLAYRFFRKNVTKNYAITVKFVLARHQIGYVVCKKHLSRVALIVVQLRKNVCVQRMGMRVFPKEPRHVQRNRSQSIVFLV